MWYIGRLSAIGLGVEATRWTAVAPAVWIAKESGVLNPSIESATDESWYGVIDWVYDSYTTKNSSNSTIQGIARDNTIWYLLLWALGKYTKLYCVSGTPSWWTPARWDVVSWNGAVLKKIIKIWTTDYYFFDKEVTWSISNGTRTMTATAVAVDAHFFEVKQDNEHPSFTIYDDDPVAWSYAPYCMVNSLEISCAVADYVKYSVEFMWKQMKPIESSVTPAYLTENEFTASMAWVRFANNEAWLNSASEQCMQNFRLTINKNLADIQCFGDDDIADIYNQQFTIDGDFEAVYESTTLRDYVLNSQKKAVRFYAINKNASALATGIYPSIYVDLMKAGFNEWTKSDSNDEVVKQTMWFAGQYSNDDWTSIEVLLINDNSDWY